MKLPGNITPLLTCMGIILVTFIAVSLFDIVLAVLNPRFYSVAAFIVSFGVGGIFAGTIAYTNCISLFKVKNEKARWTLIGFIILIGMLFFFPLSKMEGGEYGPAFKAFGITLAASSLLFAKGKPD